MNEMVMVGGMPDARDVDLLRSQYQKAVNGLYEAYLFGVMLQKVKAALEAQGEGLPQGANAAPCTPAKAQGALPQMMGENGDEMGASPEAFTGSLTRENAREMTQRGANGGSLAAGGWNAGMGLKGWLAKAAPEVNYKTAMRFLAVAERCQEAVRPGVEGWDYDYAVRNYLEGKSQRRLLAAPKAKVERSPDQRAQHAEEVFTKALSVLESMVRTGESALIGLEARREAVTRLKLLVKDLQLEGGF